MVRVRVFFGSFFPRSRHSFSLSFSSLFPLACNEEGCPTLKSLFISRVGRALPHEMELEANRVFKKRWMSSESPEDHKDDVKVHAEVRFSG